MDVNEQIRQSFRRLAGEVGPLNSILVQVVSVDEDEKTCEVIDDDVTYYDVRLRPVINGKESITVYPKVNTWALMLRIEDDDAWQIVSVDEADKVSIKVGTTEMVLNDGFLIKKGDDTLKIILNLIVEAVQQIVVLQGNNPDYEKLAQATTKISNLLK